MELKSISEEYQKNLDSFFRDDTVIDIIYEEQYGKANYNKKKEAYKKEYTNIMNNTIFIPYITLAHLENFIKSARKKYGDIYVKNNLKSEEHLLSRLSIKRDQIVEHEYSLLFEEIKKISPRLQDVDFKSALNDPKKPKTMLSDLNQIKENIISTLDDNKKQLFPLKRKKITDLIDKYTRDVNDKILIETTTYYKHRADVPSNKNYPNILGSIKDDGQFVNVDPTATLDRRCRYIYLPILKYQNKDQYLTYAVHEVMHVSKEKNTSKSTQTGFKNLLPVKHSKLKNLLSALRWSKAKKDYADLKQDAFPDDPRKCNIIESETAFEEVTHHWQARKVAEKLKNSPVFKNFKMPYLNQSKTREDVTYEEADITAIKFMNNFGEDIQAVNSGDMSAEQFKKKVGKSSFDNLSHLFDIWTSVESKTIVGNHIKQSIAAPSGQAVIVATKAQYDKALKETEPIKNAYSEMGSMIVDQMIFNASKYKQKNSIVSKTLGLAADKICSIGTFISNAKQEKVQMKDNNSEER